ncbi:MAG: hypothetical protein E6K67_00835 [Nitrospirae bacterium]|nr:MAG: hypothetical protein E6K67_00835 [Nitrospirota bacterium]
MIGEKSFDRDRAFVRRLTRAWQWQSWPPRIETLLATPLIYAMVVPLAILDLCLECYQRLVFRLLEIPLVTRRGFIRIDRHRLAYLDPIQKLGCLYCGYANGLLHYASRVAAQTEEAFCPIQHEPAQGFHPPSHHGGFAPYGDREGFEERWAKRQGSQSPAAE